MEWIKIEDQILPSDKRQILFCISGHYGGPAIHVGSYVKDFSNQHVGPKRVFIGNNNSVWDVFQVSHWAEIEAPTT